MPVQESITALEKELTANWKSKKANTRMDVGFFGDPPGIRTPDPLLKRQLLYRLS